MQKESKEFVNFREIHPFNILGLLMKGFWVFHKGPYLTCGSLYFLIKVTEMDEYFQSEFLPLTFEGSLIFQEYRLRNLDCSSQVMFLFSLTIIRFVRWRYKNFCLKFRTSTNDKTILVLVLHVHFTTRVRMVNLRVLFFISVLTDCSQCVRSYIQRFKPEPT